MLQKYIHSRQKNSEIKDHALCLDNVSIDFTINNLKKSRIKTSCIFFLVDFNTIGTNNILDIYKYLMKRT